mgnify:CR=1 FL=1
MPSRRTALALIIAAHATPALAHHGWRWTADGTFERTGRITAARLGSPHGVLTVRVNREDWTVEVGQPWRNDHAGLTPAKMAEGTEIQVRGRRHADPAQRIVKAQVIVIAGTEHVLYPDRV